jgi:hypothetical protein
VVQQLLFYLYLTMVGLQYIAPWAVTIYGVMKAVNAVMALLIPSNSRKIQLNEKTRPGVQVTVEEIYREGAVRSLFWSAVPILAGIAWLALRK